MQFIHFDKEQFLNREDIDSTIESMSDMVDHDNKTVQLTPDALSIMDKLYDVVSSGRTAMARGNSVYLSSTPDGSEQGISLTEIAFEANAVFIYDGNKFFSNGSFAIPLQKNIQSAMETVAEYLNYELV